MATAMLELSSTVHGYHVYKRSWNAMIGEVLQAEREEPRNVYNRYAVILMKTSGLLGMSPRRYQNCAIHCLLEEVKSKQSSQVQDILPIIYLKVAWMSHVDTYSPETEPLFKDSNMHLRK